MGASAQGGAPGEAASAAPELQASRQGISSTCWGWARRWWSSVGAAMLAVSGFRWLSWWAVVNFFSVLCLPPRRRCSHGDVLCRACFLGVFLCCTVMQGACYMELLRLLKWTARIWISVMFSPFDNLAFFSYFRHLNLGYMNGRGIDVQIKVFWEENIIILYMVSYSKCTQFSSVL